MHNWTLLYRDTFTLALFVKVSKHAGTFCENIVTTYRVPKHYALLFCKLL